MGDVVAPHDLGDPRILPPSRSDSNPSKKRDEEKGKGLEGGDGGRGLVEAHLIHRPPPVSVADRGRREPARRPPRCTETLTRETG